MKTTFYFLLIYRIFRKQHFTKIASHWFGVFVNGGFPHKTVFIFILFCHFEWYFGFTYDGRTIYTKDRKIKIIFLILINKLIIIIII